MLNCWMENDCTYVRENYSALSEAVIMGQRMGDCHMVFKFPPFSNSIYSIFSFIQHYSSFSKLYKDLIN